MIPFWIPITMPLYGRGNVILSVFIVTLGNISAISAPTRLIWGVGGCGVAWTVIMYLLVMGWCLETSKLEVHIMPWTHFCVIRFMYRPSHLRWVSCCEPMSVLLGLWSEVYDLHHLPFTGECFILLEEQGGEGSGVGGMDIYHQQAPTIVILIIGKGLLITIVKGLDRL